MRRDVFGEEHSLFRDQCRRFVEKEVEPRVAEWNARGSSDRETWRKAGEAGRLGGGAPAGGGGAGADARCDASVMEEWARVRAHAMMVSLHSDICMPYLVTFGSEAQKRRWLPGAIQAGALVSTS